MQKSNQSTTPSSSSRRSFLKKSTTAGFGFTFIPAYLTSARAAGNPKLPPSQRLNFAAIGTGGRGTKVIPSLTRQKTALPIALVDVDFENPTDVGKVLAAYPDAKRYHDFRKMFEEMGDDIDAVSVATPDHTHFTAAIQAMSLGKHVYVEKPLTHTFEESEILMRAEKKFKVVTQMGNQGHTSAGASQFKQLVADGVVDDIVKIEAWKSPALWFMDAQKRISAYPEGEALPPALKNWDLWCGPCEKKPFNALYHPFDWRGFHLYGSGMFGDWGAHIIDFAHNFLNLGLPTKINTLELGDHNDIIFPLTSDILFEFPARGEKLPALELHWKAGGKDFRPKVSEKYAETKPDGTKQYPKPPGAGTLLHRKQEDYIIQRQHHQRESTIFPLVSREEHAESLALHEPELDHFESFVQAAMGNGKTESPFSRGGLLTQVLTLGMIAERLNTNLDFDPATKRFINNDTANALLAGPAPRAEWAGHYKLA